MYRPNKQIPQMFSVADIATRMSVCPKTIRRAIKSGELVAHRLGGRDYRISEDDLRAWLGGRRT